jgi:hypothetical protein
MVVPAPLLVLAVVTSMLTLFGFTGFWILHILKRWVNYPSISLYFLILMQVAGVMTGISVALMFFLRKG